MVVIDPRKAVRGRGAVSNPTGRFEKRQLTPFDDGWGDDIDDPEGAGENSAVGEPMRLPTTVIPEKTRRAITRSNSPDLSFDRSLNPYKGCENGCVYCFARPSHAYVGLSPGIDFETKIFSKPDAPERLREELLKKSYHCAPITLGANTDPYQPVERELKISRRLLEVLREFRHPVSIITKSALVQRDADILADMARDNLAQVFVSTTTLEKSLARIMEPRAATPEKRLETIEVLNKAGVPTHVMTAPMIPFVNDHELERILEAAYTRGARRAGYVLVRLPHELKDLIEEWLERHFPDRKQHVLNTIRQTRGGQLYESTWGVRMTGTGPYAQAIAARFNAACRRFGFNLERTELDTTKFRPPEEKGAQMGLFR